MIQNLCQGWRTFLSPRTATSEIARVRSPRRINETYGIRVGNFTKNVQAGAAVHSELAQAPVLVEGLEFEVRVVGGILKT